MMLALVLPTSIRGLAVTRSTASRSQAPRLGFLSFDLDDTLFSTSDVVREANDLMIAGMNELNYPTTLEAFMEATRSIRQQKGKTSNMTYTDLRKGAIRAEMERLGASVARYDLVEHCFDVWLTERNAAAARYLFPSAVACLQEIQANHPQACIGAITNGRGDPLEIPPLQPFFNFCVSGEDEDVHPHRKPHAGIYEKALRLYREANPTHDDESFLWIHVGDCLANDVGGSAACGASAVWFAPEEVGVEAAAAQLSSSAPQPSYSTASTQEVETRSKLASQAQSQIAVRVKSLQELPAALDTLLSSAATADARVNP
jgi:putative hydrolase of the HAD superfamily